MANVRPARAGTLPAKIPEGQAVEWSPASHVEEKDNYNLSK